MTTEMSKAFPRHITLATWNIQRFQHGTKLAKDTLQELAETEGASVICLQEGTSRYGMDTALDSVYTALPGWEIVSFTSPEYNEKDGLVTAWNARENGLTLIDSTGVLLPVPDKRGSIFQKGVTAIKGQQGKIGAQFTEFETGESRFRVTNMHLSDVGGIKHRLKQVEHVQDHIMKRKSAEHEIFCGDLNTIGLESISSNIVQSQTQKIRRLLHSDSIDLTHEIKYTHSLLRSVDDTIPHAIKKLAYYLHSHGIDTFQKLDHIFGAGVTLVRAKVLSVAHSDHSPLIATFGLRGMIQDEEL